MSNRGELDAIAPVAVPDHVWVNYLEDREVPANYWRIPCTDHYLQVDEPEIVVEILNSTIEGKFDDSEIKGTRCVAVRIH